jgi:hypothetical protein
MEVWAGCVTSTCQPTRLNDFIIEDLDARCNREFGGGCVSVKARRTTATLAPAINDTVGKSLTTDLWSGLIGFCAPDGPLPLMLLRRSDLVLWLHVGFHAIQASASGHPIRSIRV